MYSTLKIIDIDVCDFIQTGALNEACVFDLKKKKKKLSIWKELTAKALICMAARNHSDQMIDEEGFTCE